MKNILKLVSNYVQLLTGKTRIIHATGESHNLQMPPQYEYPENGFTAGNNNVYYFHPVIRFGHSALTGGNYLALCFKMPFNYVEGSNFTVSTRWKCGLGSRNYDYIITAKYVRDGVVNAQHLTGSPYSGVYTSHATPNAYDDLDITVTGTGLQADDYLMVHITMRDQGTVQHIDLKGYYIEIQVDEFD